MPHNALPQHDGRVLQIIRGLDLVMDIPIENLIDIATSHLAAISLDETDAAEHYTIRGWNEPGNTTLSM